MLTASTRRRPTVVVAVALTLVVAAIVTAALLLQRPAAPRGPAPAAPATGQLRVAQAVPAPPTTPTVVDAVPASPEPVGFARSVAVALLGWDTTAPSPREEYLQRIVTVADPSGVETPGLVADLAAYLPSEAAWAHLTGYSTRQWLDVTTAVVPDRWASMLATTPPGVLADGTTAVTITGTRHRAGVWEGEPVADRFAVAFTLFVVCEPTYPTCHLLRLGRLDHPMR
jgi:hypothetical protein